MGKTITQEQRDRMVWENDKLGAVTLDGHPAKISGRRMPTALVWSMENPVGCEFSWFTVAHVLENGGNFKSK